MSEPQQLRESLSRALAEEPPLSFDPDALINRAQHEARRRRTLAAVAAAAVVALVAVAIPTALGLFRDHGQVSAATSPPLLTTAASTPPSSPGPFPAFYPTVELNAAAARFSQALTSLMPRVVPGVGTFLFQPWVNLDKAVPLDAKAGYAPGELATNVRFALKGIMTGISIIVDGPHVSQVPTPQSACAQWSRTAGQSCEVSGSVAGGGTVVIERGPAGQKPQQVRVVDYRPDGSVVSATAYNYDPAARTPVSYAASPFVGSDELVLLVTSPSLAFE